MRSFRPFSLLEVILSIGLLGVLFGVISGVVSQMYRIEHVFAREQEHLVEMQMFDLLFRDLVENCHIPLGSANRTKSNRSGNFSTLYTQEGGKTLRFLYSSGRDHPYNFSGNLWAVLSKEGDRIKLERVASALFQEETSKESVLYFFSQVKDVSFEFYTHLVEDDSADQEGVPESNVLYEWKEQYRGLPDSMLVNVVFRSGETRSFGYRFRGSPLVIAYS